MSKKAIICITIAGATAALFAGSLSSEPDRESLVRPAAAQVAGNPVVLENARPGSTAWQLTSPSLAREIEGYASATSVDRGGSLALHVSTSAPLFNVDIYRMGYYGGAGGRLMYTARGLTGVRHVAPCTNPQGIVECNWPASHTVTVPASADPASAATWTSGIYLAKLSTAGAAYKDSYVIFTVRDDSRKATFVAQLPVTTYQAYNYWGGKSLYTGCLAHDADWSCPGGQAPARSVSFSRPYIPSSNPAAAFGAGAGEFLANVQTVKEGYPISSAGFDYNLVRWLEKEGADVKYITNLDLHENALSLDKARAFLAMGHDEYYSAAMYDRLLAARDRGMNLGFFTANNIYWRVRFSGGAYGRANGIMTCYKYVQDPIADAALRTGLFRELGMPEAALIGSQYYTAPVTTDIQISNAAHWLLDGSGATDATVLPGLLGYEVNAIDAASPDNVVSLAHTSGAGFESDVTFYIAPSSAQVFATGSMQWSWGLDDHAPNGVRPSYLSAVAQKITVNVLDTLAERHLEALENAGSGLYLGTPPGMPDPAHVRQDGPATGLAKDHLWRLVGNGGAGGPLRIVSRATGLCLDAYGAAPGAPVGTWPCHGEANQDWLLADQGSGQVTVRSRQSGLCLESPGTSPLAELTLAGCTAQARQLWRRIPTEVPPIAPPGPDLAVLLSDERSQAFLHQDGPGAAPLTLAGTEAPVTQRTWRLQPGPTANAYAVVSVANGMCVDAYGTASGAQVGSWPCHGMNNQHWTFTQAGAARFNLKDGRSGLCLTRDASRGPILAPCGNGANQRWLRTETAVGEPDVAAIVDPARHGRRHPHAAALSHAR